MSGGTCAPTSSTRSSTVSTPPCPRAGATSCSASTPSWAWEEKQDRSYRVFHLRWESGPRALGSREPEEPPLFVLEKRRAPDEGWWLLHGEEGVLRTRRERPLAEGGTLHLLDARGENAGRVEAEGARLRVTLRSEEAPFFITEELGNMWMVRDSLHGMRVMTLLPDTPGAHLWQCVPREPMERSLAELFVLAFVSAASASHS